MFQSVGQYTKAEEYLQKALVIRKEIGDKKGEASDYGNVGSVFQLLVNYTEAEEYLQKALSDQRKNRRQSWCWSFILKSGKTLSRISA